MNFLSPRLLVFLLRLILVCGSFFLTVKGFSQHDLNYKQIGLAHLRKGEFLDAMENLNIALLSEPSSAELYFFRGYAKSNLDDFIGAERDYSRSIDLSPFRPDVFINRGIIRSQMENFPGAFSDFGKAIDLDSTNADAYVNRARANLFLKQYFACMLDCNKAIRLKDRSEGVYILKGCAEMNIKRYENALADLTMASTINPANPYSYTQRGLVHMEMNHLDSAILDMNNAIRIDSNNIYSLFNRALALSKKNDPSGALADLNKIIRLSPYNSYAYYNRAITLIGLNDKKGAIRDFTVVSKLNPTNIVSYFYRSKLKNDLKDYSGALEDLNRTIELYPEYAEAFYDRYLLKLKMNDRKGAMQDYRTVTALTKKNHSSPDSLRFRKEDYLKSLVKLSGDFEEMNTMNSKFQNQYINIELLPMYSVYLGKTDYRMVILYDAYKKDHYYKNIICLSNHEGLVTDSLCNAIIETQSAHIDSASGYPDSYWKRALAYTGLNNYNEAFKDYTRCLELDSNLVLAWFSRAGTRFGIVQRIQVQEGHQEDPVIIGTPVPKVEKKLATPELEHTFEAVMNDLDKVIQLDPGFYFASYNRGYINCKMGNYRDALSDFSTTIGLNDKFAEAFYNRGLIYILLNERSKGCQDLSRAGELGITDSYKVMKRYCNE
jgi:tetratricopeptide (TPR) repeat protein